MAKPTLQITDGTTTVTLITNKGFKSGHFLNEWIPTTATWDKTFQSSSLATGRRLVHKKANNLQQAFELKLKGHSMDDAIEANQTLFRLLEKAEAYDLTDWQNTPVYFVAKGKCETNTRYGLIVSYEFPRLDNPYRQPFFRRKPIMDNLILNIEHEHWLENVPGTDTAVALSANADYDGRTLGVETASTEEVVYVANKMNVANLTDIYLNSGAAWGSNQLDGSLPFPIFSILPGNGDILYFGIDTSLTDSGPFCSLVFDLSSGFTSISGAWEYYNGASWTALNETDNGSKFTSTGVFSVHWNVASNTTAANLFTLFGGSAPSITGLWVRFRITAAPTGAPTQQNRNIYSIVLPYVELASDQVPGDIPALARLRPKNQSDSEQLGVALASRLHTNRIICGLRSTSRGSSFVAYFNLSDEQNPAGITVAVGTNASFTTFINSPTGRVINYTGSPTNSFVDFATVTIDSTIIADFFGTYASFFRMSGLSTAANGTKIRLQVRAGTGGNIVFNSEEAEVSTGLKVGLFRSTGQLIIPASILLSGSEIPDEVVLALQIRQTDTPSAVDIDFQDIITIPTDEWAGEFVSANGGSGGDPPPASLGQEGGSTTKYLDIDSVTYPKRKIRALAKDRSLDEVIAFWQAIQNGETILQDNATQRLWILAAVYNDPGSDDDFDGPFEISHSLRISRNGQYLGFRGDN